MVYLFVCESFGARVVLCDDANIWTNWIFNYAISFFEAKEEKSETYAVKKTKCFLVYKRKTHFILNGSFLFDCVSDLDCIIKKDRFYKNESPRLRV